MVRVSVRIKSGSQAAFSEYHNRAAADFDKTCYKLSGLLTIRERRKAFNYGHIEILLINSGVPIPDLYHVYDGFQSPATSPFVCP